MAYWHCSNYIFILNLTPCFNGLAKDNYKMRWKTFKCWDLVYLKYQSFYGNFIFSFRLLFSMVQYSPGITWPISYKLLTTFTHNSITRVNFGVAFVNSESELPLSLWCCMKYLIALDPVMEGPDLELTVTSLGTTSNVTVVFCKITQATNQLLASVNESFSRGWAVLISAWSLLLPVVY